MEQPHFLKVASKSAASLLSTTSVPHPSSTTEATTAINYENVNSEIQSIRNGSPLTQFDNSSIASELHLSEYIEDLPFLPANLRNAQGSSDDRSYFSTFKNPLGLSEEQYFRQYILPSKTNDNKQFHSKLKHFFIFSTAGKPIYSMNGSDDVVIGYMGILTTILSTFQEDLHKDLSSIKVGDEVRAVALNRGPIVLFAITKLTHETDSLLKSQLHLLYSYLLSILSKSAIDKHFNNGLNYDLRRILNALDFANLDELCMKITYGLPNGLDFYLGLLFSCRQSIKVRYTLRTKMNRILKTYKDDDLLFTILAKSNVVTNLIRNKAHDLSDKDLRLLLFIVKSMKNKEEDLWMPLCMPEFNSRGFLYVFVRTWGQKSLILISGNKNSFYKLKEVANGIILTAERAQNGEFLNNFRQELQTPISSQIPFAVKHFVYVNKSLNQFICSETPYNNRDIVLQLIEAYTQLKNNKSNIQVQDASTKYKKLSYMKWESATGFMITDDSYTFYCVVNDDLDSRKLIDTSLSVIKWCKKNQSRLFLTTG
ncbi:MON1 [Candida theae]|uniref:Vacuolar fusion protein MON1 n=1 Tax=Candida theae TaxID=1198502 RepID=A0AAD5BAW0_9ASCO|nr:MON1 [Candida theae]KAI5948904.1 MON1 [Candida theae]